MGQAIIKNACFQDRNNFDIIQGRKFDSIVKFNHDVLSQYSNFTFLFADCFFFSTRTWLTLKLTNIRNFNLWNRILICHLTKIEDSLVEKNEIN